MPAGVVAVESLSDGVRVTLTDARVLEITSANLPGSVKTGSIADAQLWVNNWFGNNGYNARCIIDSLVPLRARVLLASLGVDISAVPFQ